MATFTYIGDHDKVDMFGVIFHRGVALETELPILLRKLPGNADFTQDGDDDGIIGKPSQGLSKDELKVALDAAGIAYPAIANKPELAKLLDDAK